MIKFDKDVLNSIRALEEKGFETYAAGDCFLEWSVGEDPWEWDILTKATKDDMKEIFGDRLSEDESNGAILDFTVVTEDEEGNQVQEGVYCHLISFEGNVEEALKKYGFTMLAVGDNPSRSPVDPFGGQEDIRNRMVRTVEPAGELFAREPIFMMQAIRYVSMFGFDLNKDIYEQIVNNWRKLLDYPVDEIREELELILTGKETGKALNMMADTGLMAVVYGEEVSRKMTSNEMQQFMELCENIDKTKPLRLRRLGLFYTVLSDKKGKKAIERMEFDEETDSMLKDALTETITLAFLRNDRDLKKYIYENGYEKYNYLHNLTKAQRIVYDQPALRIEARNYLLKEIHKRRDPIFVEDLAIDANDIMEAGITDDPERADELLHMLMAKVHMNASNNDRKVLLKLAKTYHKSKIRALSRHVQWQR